MMKNNKNDADTNAKESGAQESPDPLEMISEPQSAWLKNLSSIVGNGDQSKEEMTVND